MTREPSGWIASLRGLLRPRISREQAIELAREECGRRDHPWLEPVDVQSGLLAYLVIVGADRVGATRISIDKRDGRTRRFWVSVR